MHVIVPFAAPGSEAGRGALTQLTWPRLARRLAVCEIDAPVVAGSDADGDTSLSTPAERALAAALEWEVADGLVPTARLAARADGLAAAVTDAPGLALATPSHWHLGTEQISLGDPEALALDAETSRELHALVAPLFETEGFSLTWGAPQRWYLVHAALAHLPMASLDRVIGRNVDRWLVDLRADTTGRLLRRVQNEVQMRLHEHPINAERERRGLLPVNSLWFSGSGPRRPVPADVPVIEAALRRAALAEDWPAWSTAWGLLDEQLATAPWTRLTLCGERASRHFSCEIRPGPMKRLLARVRRADLHLLLESL